MTISLKVSGVGNAQGTPVADVRQMWVWVCARVFLCARALSVAGGKFISARLRTKLMVKGDF